MKKILISTSSFGKDDKSPLAYIEKNAEIKLNPYGRQLTTDELVALAIDCDGIIAGTEQITDEAIAKLPKLKVISRMGAGIDNIDLSAVKKRNIKFYSTPDAPTIPVAELTVTIILALLRQITAMDKMLKEGVWKKLTGNLLMGKNVAIVGLGRIGLRVAKYLSIFEVNIKYYDIENKSSEYEREPHFHKLLKWADIVSLHCSVNNGITPLIGQKQIEMMSASSLLINTARGFLVDEDALYNALVEKRIGGAAIDVYNDEPYKGKLCDSSLKNLIITPHIASSAMESRVQMEMESAINCVKGFLEDGVNYND